MNNRLKHRNSIAFVVTICLVSAFFVIAGLTDQVQAQDQGPDATPATSADIAGPRDEVPGIAIPPAEERYPARYPMILSPAAPESVAPAATDAPVITVWYGDTQTFGTPGKSQTWVNILGNVTNASSLTYSLNGGPAIPLRIGPDGYRLTAAGDFNAEIDYADLTVGDNTLLLTATTLNRSVLATKAVTIKYQPSTAPLAFTADWDPSIQADAQIVEGKWESSGGVMRPTELGFDRLVVLGDAGWTNYEVTVPVTVHSIDPRGFEGFASRPNIGMVMRWQGHHEEAGEGHPYLGWQHLGALTIYEWYPDSSVSLRMIGYGGEGMGSSANTDLAFNTEYIFKMSAQPAASGPAYYRFKFWPAADPEPLAWDMEFFGKDGEPVGGALGLQAHFVDASFGTAVIKPLTQIKPKLTVTPPTNGQVAVTPVKTSYTYGEKVTLTANPDLGYEFTGWGGDASGSDNPLILYMTKDTTVEANFGAKAPPKVTIIQGANGQATVEPDKTEYTYGETIRFSAMPAPGYQLYDWGGNQGGIVNPLEIMLTGDVTVQPAYGALRGPLSDDFNTCQLDTTLWTFTDPLSDSSYAIAGEEKLNIIVPGGASHDLWTGEDNVPRMMQPAEDMDMDLIAKFDSTLGPVNAQMQGILVEGASGDKVRADFSFKDRQYSVFAATISGDVATQKLSEPVTPPADSSYVRLTRQGDNWTVAHSFDGVSWVTDGDFSFAMTVEKAGVFAGNAVVNPPTTAVVDYFFNTAAPISPEDGGSHELPVTIVGQGTVDKSPDKSDYACGEQVTLTATPSAGGQFLGWSDAITGTVSPATIDFNIGDAVTATFSDVPGHTLTVTTEGNGDVSKNPDLTSYPVGSTVTLTATADVGWAFKEWQGDIPAGSTNPVLTLTMDSNKTVKAVFVEMYGLTVTTEGDGSVSKAPDQASYPDGAQVILTATADAGWGFKEWQGDVPAGSTNPVLVLTMDGDKTVKAVFEQEAEYSLTIDTQGRGSVSATPDQASYPAGSKVTLTATPDGGWVFSEWQGDVPAGSTNPTLELTMDADKTVKAVFEVTPETKVYLPLVSK